MLTLHHMHAGMAWISVNQIDIQAIVCCVPGQGHQIRLQAMQLNNKLGKNLGRKVGRKLSKRLGKKMSVLMPMDLQMRAPS